MSVCIGWFYGTVVIQVRAEPHTTRVTERGPSMAAQVKTAKVARILASALPSPVQLGASRCSERILRTLYPRAATLEIETEGNVNSRAEYSSRGTDG